MADQELSILLRLRDDLTKQLDVVQGKISTFGTQATTTAVKVETNWKQLGTAFTQFGRMSMQAMMEVNVLTMLLYQTGIISEKSAKTVAILSLGVHALATSFQFAGSAMRFFGAGGLTQMTAMIGPAIASLQALAAAGWAAVAPMIARLALNPMTWAVLAAGAAITVATISAMKARSYQTGGVVPGPIGEPVPVMAHGGEEFLGVHGERGRLGGGVSVNVYVQGSVQTERDLAEAIRSQLLRTKGRNYDTGL